MEQTSHEPRILSSKKTIVSEFKGETLTISQHVAMHQGKITIRTVFDPHNERGTIEFNANSSSDDALALAERDWKELLKGARALTNQVKDYVDIKTNGAGNPQLKHELLSHCFLSLADHYAGIVQHRERTGHGPDETWGMDQDTYFIRFRSYLDRDAFRKGSSKRVRLDPLERQMVQLNNTMYTVWNELQEAFDDDDGHDGHTHDMAFVGGGVGFDQSWRAPLEAHFNDTCKAVREALFTVEQAWRDVAGDIHDQELPFAEITRQYAERMQTAIKKAKSSYQKFERAAEDSSIGMDVARLHELMYKKDGNHKGAFPLLDAMAGIVGRENLLLDTIQQGMVPPQKRKR